MDEATKKRVTDLKLKRMDLIEKAEGIGEEMAELKKAWDEKQKTVHQVLSESDGYKKVIDELRK